MIRRALPRERPLFLDMVKTRRRGEYLGFEERNEAVLDKGGWEWLISN
jgi:hypothetical protein